jgi:hypothetical protein
MSDYILEYDCMDTGIVPRIWLYGPW